MQRCTRQTSELGRLATQVVIGGILLGTACSQGASDDTQEAITETSALVDTGEPVIGDCRPGGLGCECSAMSLCLEGTTCSDGMCVKSDDETTAKPEESVQTPVPECVVVSVPECAGSEPVGDITGDMIGEDVSNDELLFALGLGCGETTVQNASAVGIAGSVGVGHSIGSSTAFSPTHGPNWLVLSTGSIEDFGLVPTLEESKPASKPVMCNQSMLSAPDHGDTLPPPLLTHGVGEWDCAQQGLPLVGGDCSNAYDEIWSAATNIDPKPIHDYSEVRFDIEVPTTASSVHLDYLMLSTEYPFYFGSSYGDVFSVWIESPSWTGNIALTPDGGALMSNRAPYLYKSLPAGEEEPWGEQPDPECSTEGGCLATELDGTCFQGHAATNWTTLSGPVEGGESMTVVISIFDLVDPFLDTAVLVDNFRFGCGP